ncbi:MAG: lysophospholipase L1-like esterase [Planctomycetota bacterium]|jgi:lysophospholipase L1-like esterase
MNSESSSTPPLKTGSSLLIKLSLMFGVLIATLGLVEIGLRVSGFTFHLYPQSLEFGYPDPKVLEGFFKRHDDFLWVSGRAQEKIAVAREEKPYLIFSGCSCTEWGGFDEALAKRVSEEPGLAPLTYGNVASSGWSSYQGLQQMRIQIAPLKPKVVTIFYGWNDHWMGFGVDDKTAGQLAGSSMLDRQELRLVQYLTKALATRGVDSSKGAGENSRPDRVTLEDFGYNLREMVKIARASGIKPVLITAPSSHIEGDEPDYLNQRFIKDISRLVPVHQAYVNAVREVAAEMDVVLCDLAKAFEALPREELLTYMREDGIHFTPEGGAKVGDVLFATMLENDLFLKAQAAGSKAQEDGK